MNDSYVGALYNFVSLYNEVYKRYDKKEDLPKHKEIQQDKLSGYIEYTITPETDIFVGGTNKEKFYENSNKKPVIPGSTMRGLIRGNVQILGLSSVGDDIEDYKIMYREIAKGEKTSKRSEQYKDILGTDTGTITNGDKEVSISVNKNVKAGYITKEKGKYYIYKTVIDDKLREDNNNMNFYQVREDYILSTAKKAKEGNKKNLFEFLTENKNYIGASLLQYKMIGVHNKLYIPYYKPVSYKLKGNKVTAVAKIGEYQKHGYILSSGAMEDKKVIYIIPQIANRVHNDRIEINEESVKIYQRDYEFKKNKLGKTSCKNIKDEDKKIKYISSVKRFFDLPKEGQIRPVFYIHDDDKTYFGYTNNLRIFYKHSIIDGLPQQHKPTDKDKEPIWDYAKSMFGFSNNCVSYKGRVYFEDTKINGKPKFKEHTLILSDPKPSDYLDYLVQKNEDESSYNSYNDDFQLRGIKQYWLRKNTIDNTVVKKKKVGSTFEAIEKSTCKFKGKIHFKNLSQDELGLLLFAIKLEKGCSHNIGKAKAYGYGRIKIDIDKLEIFDYEKMYNTNELNFMPYSDNHKSVDDYIVCYKQYISEKINKDIMEQSSVKELLFIKNLDKSMDIDEIRYMNLDEYSENNRKPLSSLSDIMEKY